MRRAESRDEVRVMVVLLGECKYKVKREEAQKEILWAKEWRT